VVLYSFIHFVDFTTLDPFLATTTAAKPATTATLNRTALSGLGLKGLPIKPEFSSSKVMNSLDDAVESKRTLEKLEDMPAIDMTMGDDTATVGDLDVDDDDEEANRMDQVIKAKAQTDMVVDEDEVDPLDAFMSTVKEEVKKVNLEDAQKITTNGAGRKSRLDERLGEEESEDEPEPVPDELDVTGLNPEDILALAAKKAKKKEFATVDHAKVRYESFRKEFYIPPPDIAAMTEDEAELLRLALDGIKIRGIDCPKPAIKWSHFGMPASWCVRSPRFQSAS
jgi:ATP-dependent RNA helicase DDX46/PRP5